MGMSGVPFFTEDAPALARDLFTAACAALCLTHHFALMLWLRFVRGSAASRGGVHRSVAWTWGLNAVLISGSAGCLWAGHRWPFLLLPEGNRWGALLAMSGATLMGSGTFLFLWARQGMAEHFAMRALVYRNHPLLTTGAFAVSRHPLYTALMMMSFGGLMMYRHAAALWLTLWLFALLRLKAGVEEKLLCEHFGEAYERYAASTARFFPILPSRRK